MCSWFFNMKGNAIMDNFNFYSPTEFIFGKDTRRVCQKQADNKKYLCRYLADIYYIFAATYRRNHIFLHK